MGFATPRQHAIEFWRGMMREEIARKFEAMTDQEFNDEMRRLEELHQHRNDERQHT